MSWLEKVNTQLKIKCGDGKEYTPNYLDAKKGKEYNIAKFNFPNVKGTLVKRKAPMGLSFPLDIYFQGENHLQVAADFEASAANVQQTIRVRGLFHIRITVNSLFSQFHCSLTIVNTTSRKYQEQFLKQLKRFSHLQLNRLLIRLLKAKLK